MIDSVAESEDVEGTMGFPLPGMLWVVFPEERRHPLAFVDPDVARF